MTKLTHLVIRGFKSIRNLENLKLDALNIIIGPNGSGKSNLIFFFKMLNWMTNSSGQLQYFINKYGGANALLHYGAKMTPQMEASLRFETDSGTNDYYFRLFHAARETLIFAEEKFRYSSFDFDTLGPWRFLGAGHKESNLIEESELKTATTARWILGLTRKCVQYHFHDTSETARIHQKSKLIDSYYLREDGANLAPFLYRLYKNEQGCYQKIVDKIRAAAPFFNDFILEPEYDSISLQWTEKGSDYVFGSQQIPSSTLRAMSLITLLQQPEQNLPAIIILDEPELGLHPQAIDVIAGLIKSVSSHAQVVVTTKSSEFIRHFEHKDIIIVDRLGQESVFQKADSEKMDHWLKQHPLPENDSEKSVRSKSAYSHHTVFNLAMESKKAGMVKQR